MIKYYYAPRMAGRSVAWIWKRIGGRFKLDCSWKEFHLPVAPLVDFHMVHSKLNQRCDGRPALTSIGDCSGTGRFNTTTAKGRWFERDRFNSRLGFSCFVENKVCQSQENQYKESRSKADTQNQRQLGAMRRGGGLGCGFRFCWLVRIRITWPNIKSNYVFNTNLNNQIKCNKIITELLGLSITYFYNN